MLPAILAAVLPQLFSQDKLIDLAKTEEKKLAHSALRDQFRRVEQKVALDMVAAKVTVEGGKDKAFILRDAQFRLWRKLLAFKGGGHGADFMRDSQEAKVLAIVGPQVDENTPMLTTVQKVADAIVDITF